MEKRVIQQLITEACMVTPHILRFPIAKMEIDYDKEADVLYISFMRPQKATDSEMTKDGILLRYRDDELVGMTILNASNR